jgi:serine protease Do
MDDYPNNENKANEQNNVSPAYTWSPQNTAQEPGQTAQEPVQTASSGSAQPAAPWAAQPAAPNYVYPNQAYPGGGYQAPGQPGRGPDKQNQKRPGRTIGLIALFLSVAVILSAVSGGVVYTLMKDRNTVETTSTADQTEPSVTETTSATEPRETTPGSQTATELTDKHFSLADAASRFEDGKKTLTVMEIAALGKPAVVAITTEMTVTDMFGQSGQAVAAGSGFILTADGYIITNNHVIDGATTITVALDDGTFYDAKLVGGDAKTDLAVLKVDAKNLPTVYLGSSDDLQVGELAVAIGNPLGTLSGTVTAGIISALDREITLGGENMTLLQTDAAINEGNSGGALFNSFGEVIGINSAKNAGTGVEGLGFAIPVDLAKPIIESLIQNGYVLGRPKIGISARDVSAQMAEYYSMTEGIYVAEVEPGSAADKAGIIAKDIIIAADGEEALTVAALNKIKETKNPGDTMEITLVREGKEMKVTLTLQEAVPEEASPSSSRRYDNLPQL